MSPVPDRPVIVVGLAPIFKKRSVGNNCETISIIEKQYLLVISSIKELKSIELKPTEWEYENQFRTIRTGWANQWKLCKNNH